MNDVSIDGTWVYSDSSDATVLHATMTEDGSTTENCASMAAADGSLTDVDCGNTLLMTVCAKKNPCAVKPCLNGGTVNVYSFPPGQGLNLFE